MGSFFSAVIFVMGAYAVEAAPADSMKKDFSRCAAVDGELARLDCFDKTSAQYGMKKEVKRPTIAGKGKWSVSVETNPIDDTKTAVGTLTAEQGASRWGDPATLIIRCKSGEVEAYISWGSFLGMEETSVLTRIDDAPASETTWPVSTNRTSSFYPGDEDLKFVQSLIDARRLVAQVTPYGESPITAVFKLDGMRKAMTPLRDACRAQSFDPPHSVNRSISELLSPEDRPAWDAAWENPEVVGANCVGERLSEAARDIANAPEGSRDGLISAHSKMCAGLIKVSKHGEETLHDFLEALVKGH